jgi:hypothetical protein
VPAPLATRPPETALERYAQPTGTRSPVSRPGKRVSFNEESETSLGVTSEEELEEAPDEGVVAR